MDASRFRIEIGPSRRLRHLQSVFFGGLLLSVWMWQPVVIPVQWIVQCLLSGWLGWRWWRTLQQPQTAGAAMVSEDGDWQWLSADTDAQRILASSRISVWLLWVVLRPRLGKPQTTVVWIFPDAVSDQDYRRLCRILQRCRQQGVKKSQ